MRLDTNALKVLVSKSFIASGITAALIRVKNPIREKDSIIAVLLDKNFETIIRVLETALKGAPKNILKLRTIQPMLYFLTLYSIRWIKEGRVSTYDWTLYLTEDRNYCEILWVNEAIVERFHEALREGRRRAIDNFIELLRVQSTAIGPTPEDTEILHHCLEILYALYRLKRERVPDELIEELGIFRKHYTSETRVTSKEAQRAYQLIKREVEKWSA